ncbi:isocitrate dehydrogenase [NAD] subunit gamma, mitochondrial-like [Watersipora subatra]|uniref:isocitrate dehydrogenase [NAD] subunit gamma, mitochondrial-like n=1 Tax=Watersipora subatra TaxID=2589382 RepID=UPI00355BB864
MALRSVASVYTYLEKSLLQPARRGFSTALSLPEIPSAVYGGRHTVALIPGDGIGPELTGYVKEVVRFSGAPVDFEEVGVNRESSDAELENALLALSRNGVGLKGNVETDLSRVNTKSKNVAIRKDLDLFANVVRCKSLPSYRTRHSNVDLVVIRENTEGEYSQLEHENVAGVVESLKIITEKNSARIAKYAFEYAVQHKRKKVCAVHKANIMKQSDGLFLHVCSEMAKLYPSIEFSNMIIDNCAMQMVSNPGQFEVMVMPNLYGNVIGNIGTGLVGGPGATPGANIGSRCAVFEQGTRNSGRSLVGKNIANPSAMLLASADMLCHIGLHTHGETIEQAVVEVLQEPELRTPDLGGNATTLEVVQEVFSKVKEKTKDNLERRIAEKKASA